MKKIITKYLLLSVMATGAHAMQGGFYTGIGVGVQDMLSEITTTDADAFGSVTEVTDFGNTGPLGSLALGYNFLFGEYYGLGLQIDGQIAGTKIQFAELDVDSIFGTAAASLTQKFKHGVGASLRPGGAFNDFASGFLIFGYRYGKISYDLNETETGALPFNVSQNIDSHGFEYGLGTEVSLNEQLGLRLEVSQTQYKSQDLYNSPLIGSLTSKMKITNGLLSLVWYPDC